MSPAEAFKGNVDALDQTKTVESRPRPVPEPAGAGNVDKIRDILFGTQMRDYEQRFARLEETLLREAADLRESTRKRFDALESYMRKEFEALESRLKSERDERVAAQGRGQGIVEDHARVVERRNARERGEPFGGDGGEEGAEIFEQGRHGVRSIGGNRVGRGRSGRLRARTVEVIRSGGDEGCNGAGVARLGGGGNGRV